MLYRFLFISFLFLFEISRSYSQLNSDWEVLYGCSSVNRGSVTSNRVWFYNYYGLTEVDPLSTSVTERHDRFNTPASVYIYFTEFVDDDRNVWRKTSNADSSLFIITSLVNSAVDTIAIPQHYITKYAFFKNEIWCITDSLIFRINKYGYEKIIASTLGINGDFKSVSADNNYLLIQTYDGIWSYNSNEWQQLEWNSLLSSRYYTLAASEPDGTLWLLANGDLMRYRNGSYYLFNQDEFQPFISGVAYANDTLWFSMDGTVDGDDNYVCFGYIIGDQPYVYPSLSEPMPYYGIQELLSLMMM